MGVPGGGGVLEHEMTVVEAPPKPGGQQQCAKARQAHLPGMEMTGEYAVKGYAQAVDALKNGESGSDRRSRWAAAGQAP
jgi:hypothetical protein